MKTQIKKKSVTKPNKSVVKAKVKLKSKTKPKVKPKLSSTAYLKHVKNLKIRLSIEPKMTLHQKNRLKLASTKNLQKFTSLCKLTEISTAMNAQVVEAVGSSISKNQGFNIDVINSKFNLKTNRCQISLKFNAKKKSQFTTLVGKIFGKKIKNPSQFLYEVDSSILFTRLSKYLKKMIQNKTRKEVIRSKLAYVELNGMTVLSLKLNGHTVFKK